MGGKAFYLVALFTFLSVQAAGCGTIYQADNISPGLDTTHVVFADRFGAEAEIAGDRNASDRCDSRKPFISRGVGPNGEPVEYFNFDARSVSASGFVFSGGVQDTSGEGQIIIVSLMREMRANQ